MCIRDRLTSYPRLLLISDTLLMRLMPSPPPIAGVTVFITCDLCRMYRECDKMIFISLGEEVNDKVYRR